MGLKKYRRMRRFGDTPEPRGKATVSTKKKGTTSPNGALRFVVQEHHASHLHYDFRLEVDGTLKSWAIPKGPSLSPREKRLAVQVEDHPLEYRDFQGTIPKGNYGAGQVKIWDRGTFHAATARDRAASEKDLREGLRKGRLSFVLQGKRLHGEFSLVRMARGDGRQWLLVKKADRYARDGEPHPEGATDRAIASELSREKPPARKVPLTAVTTRVRPMLATLVDEPFDRPGWLFEVKWDGYRTITEIRDGHVEMYSRSHKPFSEKFAALVPELGQIGHNAILDGEVCALDEHGVSSFQLLQNYQRTGEGRLVYYVFDLLMLDGHDLRDLPLLRRKETLRHILPELPLVRYSDHIDGRGVDFFRALGTQGLEGMVAKDGLSPYREGKRTGEWVKVKAHARQEAVIAGYTEPRGTREKFGSLVLGVYEKGRFVYIGHAGTGFTRADLGALFAKLAPLRQQESPFDDAPKATTPVQWVKPRIVCEVAFQEWTDDGLMRQPRFLGVREDKAARNVKRERAKRAERVVARAAHRGFLSIVPGEKKARGKRKRNSEKEARTATTARPQLRLVHDARSQSPAAELAPAVSRRLFGAEAPSRKRAAAVEIAVAGRAVRLTHLDKLYFPDDGIRKGDLIDYYRQVAPVMLKYLEDRPESLHRYPEGIAGEGFFQKDVAGEVPRWVRTTKIPSVADSRDILYLMCQDEATLLYLANQGCLELNPWHSRVGKLDYPDYLVLDLDPEAIGFDKVVETAHAARKLLDELGAPSYPKTSGATGLHLYVPLGARYHYDQVKRFAELIAHLVNQRIPRWTSVVRSPAQRQKRVYLDFLQNRRGQTVVAPYSVRPRPGAPVSAPLTWDEVTRTLDPSAFTLRTLVRRLDKRGDLFEPVLGEGIDLLGCLDRLAGKTADR